VFVAMREVEIRVRELAGATDSDLGTKLMDKAFAPGNSGPLVDHDADGGEQQATLALFKGAIGLFKNPTSHRAVRYDDPAVASDAVLLADLLLRLLDQIVRRQSPRSNPPCCHAWHRPPSPAKTTDICCRQPLTIDCRPTLISG
jgi:uncharacterized protein (TIGR02391 family)